MRRSSIFYCLVFCAAVLNVWIGPAVANFHTEGGNFKLPSGQPAAKSGQVAAAEEASEPQQYYDLELADSGPANNQYLGSPAAVDENALAGIVRELNEQMRRESEAYDENTDVGSLPTLEDLVASSQPKVRNERVVGQQQSPPAIRGFQPRQPIAEEEDTEIEELQQLGKKFRELTQAKAEQEQETNELVDDEQGPAVPVEKPKKHHHKNEEEKPLSAQKKGQSEYVEFIEPVQAKKLKNKEYMTKRVASDDERLPSHKHHYRAFNIISSSGNLVFVAFITMCCVFSVVGVVGGMYYYNHVKVNREDPFDDFTRYSPAGPGRDKLKKGRNSPFGGEKGDESLAYKAQLHHYQQTKQKIIGEQAGVGGNDVDASDKSDDEADLEHNFSVYECPGLAPTGDIEVQNPNFIESPTSGKKAPVIATSH